ncbi:hypothetical protein GJAV_G00211400 [Gymnothorax javanicus]|nr:hypothetical protein GJAV_G00211400 [Gymnothorax javanicus]
MPNFHPNWFGNSPATLGGADVQQHHILFFPIKARIKAAVSSTRGSVERPWLNGTIWITVYIQLWKYNLLGLTARIHGKSGEPRCSQPQLSLRRQQS